MAAREQPYDPYIPSGGTAGTSGGNAKTDKLHGRLQETLDVMEENVKNLRDRGENIDTLQQKTDNLAVSSHGFRRGANKIRKNMWWKDMKMRLCIIAIIVIIIIIAVVVPIATKGNK